MNLGKFWPQTVLNHLTIIENDWRRGLPRMMKLVVFSGSPTGSVAALWANSTWLSEVAERWVDDSRANIYHFINTTDPTATIDIITELVEVPPQPPFGFRYSWKCTYRAYDGATLLAHREVTPVFTQIWGDPVSDTQVGPEWLDAIDHARWFRISMKCGAARWSDQPDYQPYHTRP